MSVRLFGGVKRRGLRVGERGEEKDKTAVGEPRLL